MTLSRIDDPRELAPLQLTEIGMSAAWLAKISEAITDLAALVGNLDLPAEEQVSSSDQYTVPWEADALEVAHHIVATSHVEGRMALEKRLAAWLSGDPDHWQILRRVVFNPWQKRSGKWQADIPDWITTLDPIATRVHEQRVTF